MSKVKDTPEVYLGEKTSLLIVFYSYLLPLQKNLFHWR